jgi:glycosyltransferase involved in cell wall biosynthesis
MKIAIAHYHLNRGGVTQVIANHLRSLDAATEAGPLRVALLYGGRKQDWPDDLASGLKNLDATLHTVEGLDYDTDAEARPDQLAQAMQSTLQQIGFTAEDSVLHVHNHNLGKNASLPGALHRLAVGGYPLLLHIHDFAEDYRPDNYGRLTKSLAIEDPADLAAILYPQASHIHYAVLNGRDRNVLAGAGTDPNRLHYLPNPVAAFGDLPSREAARCKLAVHVPALEKGRFILYPVRGIRRKNLGETVLWSALADADTHVGVTLAPLNPVEQRSYEMWKGLAGQLKLRCHFEVGTLDGVGFYDNLAAANAILTTSVAEGFGMVFLESWTAGRALVGRDLPEITADFVQAGVDLGLLYSALRVPLAWVGMDAFRDSMRGCYMRVRPAFGLSVPTNDAFDAELQRVVADDEVDFACLEMALQRQVVERVCRDGAGRDMLLERNPALKTGLSCMETDSDGRVSANASVVRDVFSLRASGQRLLQLYASSVASPRTDQLGPPASGRAILDAFLSLSRLQPLRVES